MFVELSAEIFPELAIIAAHPPSFVSPGGVEQYECLPRWFLRLLLDLTAVDAPR
jgi:hypothetical protein